MDSPNPLSNLLDNNRLTGPNFNDWLRNLRIVLYFEKLDYVLDNPPVKKIQEEANEEEKATFNKWTDDNNKARCYMLASMNNVLQKQYFNMESAYEILLHLQKMDADLRVNRYNISKKLFRMRMSDELSVHEHALKMVDYIQQLENLGACMSKDLAADLILQSLPKSFSQFIMNFNRNSGDYTLVGLVNMLTSAEATIKKAKDILLESSKSSISKAEIKGKTEIKGKAEIEKAQMKSKIDIKKALLKPKGGIKKAFLKPKGGIKKAQPKPKGAQLNSESSVKKTAELCELNCKEKCFQCGKEGHLKKDCKDDYLTVKYSSVEATENSDEWHMWKKPEFGWIKLNTDGCPKGFGGLFRDHDGKPLFAYVIRGSTDDIFLAELCAVLRGINLAYLQGIKFLWVESDSMCVVKMINREQSCPPMSAIYLDQIWQLLGLFEKFQISHSWRECNRAADHLSKMEFIVNDVLVTDAVLSPVDFPERLCTIIKEDAEGRLYHRRKSSSKCQTESV